jgi:outer membrane protein TolC
MVKPPAAPQDGLRDVEASVTSQRAAGVLFWIIVVALAARPLSAQAPLSLAEAIGRARAHNPDAASATVGEREAAERVLQARGGSLPRVDVTESWQRGNSPVFVFSSLLAQRRFTAADFAVEALNHPAAADNFRTALVVEQTLLDRSTSARIESATIGRDMASSLRRIVDQTLAAAVTDMFGRVLVADAMADATAAAVETARADRELAGNRRDAGRATDADVLQLDVHLARTVERQVQAIADERIARARLNQLMGEPLTAVFVLDRIPADVAVAITNPSTLADEAVKNRPEVAIARQQERLATATVHAARAAFLPQVSAQGSWELNGDAWQSRSSSWMVGAAARISVFNGFADKARLAEAQAQVRRRSIEASGAETLVRLDVHIGIARLEAARASEAVARAAADSARASHRIIQDRYNSGLADATTLLRAAEAVEQADAQQIAGFVNVITATATLQRATGTL